MTATRHIDNRPNAPEPNRNPGQGATLFSVLSVVASLLVIGYGVSFLNAAELTRWQAGFGCVSILYGLAALTALWCAYRSGTGTCVVTIQISAVFYLLIYVMALTASFETGFGPAGILLLAMILWCNWFAVNKAVRKKRNA